MPKKPTAKKKSSVKAKATSSKSRKSPSKQSSKPLDPSARRFVRDLLIRGEAAKPDAKGELPPGATHRIVEDDEEGGLPKVERERFSLY